ncbi:related to mitochondrial ribosomal protein [Ramularia collo-cygni]|uniref:Related to mitochondrial ribosomal protein n=1 Tax=Ramularia collo-cygni TaxID=112498 RepID=A0A2D3UNA0_9PEZI|nr:related to mitochondrial ribosomal protein [Ramularia collo-cygni]CZT17392.1 related to mitochondrial ribosomal protein [Ramularia collo-cygni]
MQATRRLLHRQPMIRFLGKRSTPQKIDHAPKVHPESPSSALPESFASYREQATQHGPLKGTQRQSSSSAPQQVSSVQQPYGAIGGRSARELGPIKPGKGEFSDRSELPKRFQRTPWSLAEIEAIESGGASMFA